MKFRIVIALLLAVQALFAQNFSVQATLEPAQIQIGEQARLRLSLAQDKGAAVVAPILSDTITQGLEIVERVAADTLSLGGGRLQINADYLVTAFDSGFYFIPSYAYAMSGDTVQTAPLGLLVTTVMVDAQSDDIHPIKEIMGAPFLWQEFFLWVGYVLLALLVLALVLFVLLKYVLKKKVSIIAAAPAPVIPPHIVALNRLEGIKAEKTWQRGDIKAFYTEITDVLRVYLEGRFDICAMELTSDEIMALVKKVPEMDEVRQELRALLSLADFVKFAKMIPLENENEQSLLTAFDVVDKTKPVEEPEVD